MATKDKLINLEDLKVLSDHVEGEVTDLKSDFNQLGNMFESVVVDGSYSYNLKWELGNISSGTSEVDSDLRKRTVDFVNFGVDADIFVTVPQNNRIIGWEYSAPSFNGYLKRTFNWQTDSFVIKAEKDKYYRFVISSTESDVVADDSGFAFLLEDTLTEKIVTLFKHANNLLNPSECVDGVAISSTDGSETGSTSYWSTGFINVDGVTNIILSNSVKLRLVFYDANKTFISYTAQHNPISVPANCKYIRVTYAKSVVSYADRYNLSIYEYGTDNTFNHYNIINDSLYSVKDNQYFHVNKGTYSESFTVEINRGNLGNKNMVITAKTSYTGTTKPTIQFKMPYSTRSGSDVFLYESQLYDLGDANVVEEQQFRVPPFPNGQVRLWVIVTIPSGTILDVDFIENKYSDNIFSNTSAFRFNSHLGHLYPANTYSSFACAAKVGYPCCVTVPKRTSDGVWVCFHDDNNVGNTLLYPDGSSLSTSDASKAISDFTYSQLLAFDCGIKTNLLFAGEKIPTLESFFKLCSKTGMHPMLSCHPVPTESEWTEIKALAKKCGVLHMLNIKGAGTTFVSNAYAVFGDAIESYARDVSVAGVDVTEDTSWYSSLTFVNSRIGVEYYNSVINQTLVENAINNGLFVACYIAHGTASRYVELLDMGVTEITDDNNCSNGLNW